MFLYAVTNLVNGKRYIGITNDFRRRWQEHRVGHGSKLIYQALKKYGIKNLNFEVICKGTEDYVKEMEVRAIRMLNTMAHSGYNLTAGGEGSSGWQASDATRKKMRDSHRGTTGQTMADATKQKIRESRLKYTGEKHPLASRVVVNGVSYGCIRDAAESLDVVYSTLCTYQRNLGTNVFDYPPKKEVFNVNGVDYNSRLEASKALGVSNATICNACKKAGSNTFEYYGRPKRSCHPRATKVIIDGIEYDCIKDAAKSLGVNYSTLRDAHQRAKSDTFTYNRGKSPKPKGGVSSPESNSKTL